MAVRVTVEVPPPGKFRADIEALTDQSRRALTIALTGIGEGMKVDLRQDVMRAGLGQRLAGTIRARVFENRDTGNAPAAVVDARDRAADAILAGQSVGGVRVPKAGRFLVWPTGFNALLGRRNAGRRGGLRVTPEEMMRPASGAFVVRTGNPDVSLWCLPLRQASGIAPRGRTRRGRLLLFVSDAVEVATGRRKGQQAFVRALAERGFVPMFFLARSVKARKLLSPEAALAQWSALAPEYLSDAFDLLERGG